MLNDLLNAVHDGKVQTTSNGNESGTLWEKLWRWTEEYGYQSKVCSPGMFSGWHTYYSRDEFLSCLDDEIRQYRFGGI